jgi:hypothetical protein
MPDDTRSLIGHNSGAALKEVYEQMNAELPAQLEADNSSLLERTAELLDGSTRVPATITNEEQAAMVSDFIGQITKTIKEAEAKREDIKAGPLAAGRLIDVFFKKRIVDRLTESKATISLTLTQWQRKKAEEERKRREAEEAEKRRIAEEARLKAEEERRRIEAEAAEKRRKAEEDARRAAEAARTEQAKREAEERAQRERERIARDEVRQKEEAARAARQAEADALAAQRASEQKSADMHKTRGDYGSMASLRTIWLGKINEFPISDITALALKAYISKDAWQKALNAAIAAGQRPDKDGNQPIPGCTIYPEERSVVRA